MHPVRGKDPPIKTASTGAVDRGASPSLVHVIASSAALVAAGALLLWLATLAPAVSRDNGQAAKNESSSRASWIQRPPLLATSSARAGKPRVGLFTAIPARLPPSGGTVRLLAVVQHATTCQFSSTTALHRLPSSVGCATGTAAFELKLPANTSPSGRTYRFRVTATSSHGSATAAPVTVLVVSPLSRAASAPAISTQPTSTTVAAGTSTTFVAAASGVPTPGVQWQVSTDGGHNWADLAGATAVTLSLAATASESGDEYRAVFTNAAGSAATNPAVLTVAPAATLSLSTPRSAPTVTAQPTNQFAVSAANATFTAAAAGNPTPTVQWQVSADGGASWADVGGATSGSYSFTASTAQNGYRYRAMFTNAAGVATTDVATLTVSAAPVAPTITTHPASQSAVAGTEVTFIASASGSPTPTVQWQVSTNGGESWANVGGATSSSYSFTTSGSESGYEYRAAYTNATGSATTNAATLTVSTPDAAPTVSTQPSNQTIYSGGSATFTAVAAGTPSPTVQWQVSTNAGASWGNVAGATSTTLSFYANIGASGWQYRAVFTNLAGSVTTAAATLTVLADGPTSPDWSGYVVTGATFSAVNGSWTVPTVSCPAGATTYSFEWVGIDGETDNTVEQDGTAADCTSGSPTYFAWYEMYGDATVNGGNWVALPTADSVSPGDAMSASVSVTGSTWLLDIQDHTRPWSFTTSIPSPSPAPAQTSAEWIVELPGGAPGSDNTLSNFGNVTFTGATADGNGAAGTISAFSAHAIDLVSGSTVLAAPGSLVSAGNGFTDTYTG